MGNEENKASKTNSFQNKFHYLNQRFRNSWTLTYLINKNSSSFWRLDMKKTDFYIHKRSFHWLYKWVIYDSWNVNRFVKYFRGQTLGWWGFDLDDFLLVALTIRGWRPRHPALKVQHHQCLPFRWSKKALFTTKPSVGVEVQSPMEVRLSTTLSSRSDCRNRLLTLS